MTSEDLPGRKKIRLEGYDYSANGLYFVTICVTEKYQILRENVGANSVRPFFGCFSILIIICTWSGMIQDISTKTSG